MYINKLKKKLIKSGFNSLTQSELLQYLLFYVTRRDSFYNEKLSLELLKKYGSIYNLIKIRNYKYINSNIISEDLFIFLRLINGLIENEVLYKTFKDSKYIFSSSEVYNYLRFSMAHLEHEVFKVIFLNTRNEIVAEEILFHGTIDQSNVYIREIVKKVIYYNSKSIILAHNHPSGNLEPSVNDKFITKMISEFLEKIDVIVLDHIILSSKGYFSFIEGGLIESYKH